MKTLGRIGIISALFASITFTEVSAFASDSYDGCQNCSAEVTLPFSKANQLIESVMLISSMPLDGRLTFVDDGPFPVAKVEIGTLVDYARQNQLDSFDVARKLTMFASDPRWEIISIEAKVNFTEDIGDTETIGTDGGSKRASAYNAGTIGH